MAKISPKRPPSLFKGPAPAQKEPVYVRSLTVENVRCFGNERQELWCCKQDGRPNQWTVLIGDNGTGKSTLLQSLVAFDLLEPYSDMLLPVPRLLAWLLQGEDPDVRFVRVGERQDCRLVIVTEWGTSLVGTGAKPSTGRMEIVHGTDKSGNNVVPEVYRKLPLSIPTFYAYGAARRMGRASLSDPAAVDAAASLYDDKADLRNAEEWLLKLDYSASKESEVKTKQRQRFEQVRRLLIQILPDVDDIRVSVPSKRRPQPAVEFKTPDGWIPLKWIGYGYQTLIAWIVDFASRMVDRYPRHKDPLWQPAVVLVDEIDLHLHPKWQRKVMTFLSERFPNTQFIVTAHSPIFVQAAAGANITVLRRDRQKGHVVIDNSPEAIRGWRIDQLLTSDLFGFATARPPELEPLLLERKRLLAKSRLTKADKIRLSELEKKIGVIPDGETADDAKTRQRLDRTLDALEKQLEKGS
jgi:energy-coupling factor transporter ATP-binding protein EcfA2